MMRTLSHTEVNCVTPSGLARKLLSRDTFLAALPLPRALFQDKRDASVESNEPFADRTHLRIIIPLLKKLEYPRSTQSELTGR